MRQGTAFRFGAMIRSLQQCLHGFSTLGWPVRIRPMILGLECCKAVFDRRWHLTDAEPK